MPKKKKEKPLYDENGRWADEKRMVIGAIRILFRQSPQFKEVHEASRVEVPRFNKDGSRAKKDYVKRTCEICGELFSSTNIAIDHIKPMVPLHLSDNDLTYNELVRNIICDKSNLQRACNPKKGKKNKPKFLEFCHQKKSHKENFIRTKWRQRFEEKGITSREGKDAEYSFFKHLEQDWEEEYKIELANKIAELEEKERKKQERLNKRLLKK
jgi:hypothetical protein